MIQKKKICRAHIERESALICCYVDCLAGVAISSYLLPGSALVERETETHTNRQINDDFAGQHIKPQNFNHFNHPSVKLPSLLVHTRLDEKAMAHVISVLSDILKFMKKNISTLFVSADYEPASADYVKNAQA